MNRIISILLINTITLINSSSAQDYDNINIKLFSSSTSNKSIITVRDGAYFLLYFDVFSKKTDTIAKISDYEKGEKTIYFKSSTKGIIVKTNTKNLGNYSSIYLKPESDTSTFIIKYDDSKARFYEGALLLKNSEDYLEILNNIDIERYVAGVVESEVGSKGNDEFYKVQAILVRTYALKNFNKFDEFGFNLTDDVRSQVFLSKSYFVKDNQIINAVNSTKGKVIIGNDGKLIEASFHANSGGKTVNSEDVWVSALPYLKAKDDPFSMLNKEDNIFWDVEINKKLYLKYFYDQTLKYNNNIELRKKILTFTQDERKVYFSYKDLNIPLKNIRKEFGLKSTYFSVTEGKDIVILSGKGYGHGVGLSQIGARNMGERGYNSQQIINYYYDNVKIVNFNNKQANVN